MNKTSEPPTFNSIFNLLLRELRGAPRLIQVIIGPRQVGKTTLATSLITESRVPSQFAAADSSPPFSGEWIELQWRRARTLAKPNQPAVLVLDEIQKVSGWSETVKRLWDEDKREGHPLHVLLLGSSALLLQHGLTESLAGRFFLHRLPHRSLQEMEDRFQYSLDEWIFLEGNPEQVSFA